MAQPRLVSARWLKNHGVSLRYAGNGSTARLKFVPPDGALTVGEVAKLLNVYPLQVYRLVNRGVLTFKDRSGVATVPLKQIRKYGNGK
jgi:hypothetical protein